MANLAKHHRWPLGVTLALATALSAACDGGADVGSKGSRTDMGDPSEPPDPNDTVDAVPSDPRRTERATRDELRGVWLTDVDSTALLSRGALKSAFARLEVLNFTTVYPVVWVRGRTLYPSDVVRAITGEAIDTRPEFKGRDVMAEALAAGVTADMRVVPWFEYGFKVPAGSAFAAARPSWLTQNAQGGKSKSPDGVPMAWLNPLRPDVQKFYIDLLNEFVARYHVTRLQFDDNLSIPADMLYDDFARQAYAAEGGGSPPLSQTDARWAGWVTWRARKISDAVNQIFIKVKKSNPGLHISLSPNPWRWAVDNFLQDWNTWLAEGSVDSIVVQLYRDTLEAFESELQDPVLVAAKDRVAVGILSGLRSEQNRVGMDLVRRQVEAARRRGYGGVSFFFYESLFSFPTNGETLESRTSQIRALFPEIAKQPDVF